MKTETKCLHAGYEPKNGEPREVPIYQSTTFKYDTSIHVCKIQRMILLPAKLLP